MNQPASVGSDGPTSYGIFKEPTNVRTICNLDSLIIASGWALLWRLCKDVLPVRPSADKKVDTDKLPSGLLLFELHDFGLRGCLRLGGGLGFRIYASRFKFLDLVEEACSMGSFLALLAVHCAISNIVVVLVVHATCTSVFNFSVIPVLLQSLPQILPFSSVTNDDGSVARVPFPFPKCNCP